MAYVSELRIVLAGTLYFEGPMPVRELEVVARKRGWTKHQLISAARGLGVEERCLNGEVHWCLPENVVPFATSPENYGLAA